MQTPSFAVARDQCSLKNIAIAELHPSIEAHSLEDGAELVRALANTLARANLLAPVIGVRLGIFIGRVLNVEHGLAIVDELVKGFAFRVLIVARALLIDRKAHQVHHLINNVGRVLETDRHVVLGGLVMQKLHVVNRVLGRKTQVVFRILLETVPLVSNTNTSVKQKKLTKPSTLSGSMASQPLLAASAMRFLMMSRTLGLLMRAQRSSIHLGKVPPRSSSGKSFASVRFFSHVPALK